MLKKVISYFQNQKGNVLVIVAGAAMMLFGFTAVVVDGGSLYWEKSNLQKVLDAAALGGAQELFESENNAIAMAKSIAQKNNVNLIESNNLSSSDYIITGVDNKGLKYIEVKRTIRKDLTFAKILGIQSTDVTAVSRAVVGSLREGTGVIPIGLALDTVDFSKKYQKIKYKQVSGNWGFLDFDTKSNGSNGKGNGKNKGCEKGGGEEELEKLIKGELIVTVTVGDKVCPKTGNTNASPLMKAIQDFIDKDNNDPSKEHCKSPDTADISCSRVIIVPVIETFEGKSGASAPVEIISFAAIWLDDTSENGNGKGNGNNNNNNNGNDNGTIQGALLDIFIPSSEIGPPNQYGLKTIKLVK